MYTDSGSTRINISAFTPDGGGVAPQRRHQLPVLGGVVLQRHERRDRGANDSRIAAVATQPAALPMRRNESAIASVPASGKASTSHA